MDLSKGFRALHGEYEPQDREPKPAWQSVPQSFVLAIENYFQTPIIYATTVWGGFTPSATFAITLADNRKIFCKATHDGNTDWGRRAFERELFNFSSVGIPDMFSPEFLGSTAEGSWKAMFFKMCDDRALIPPWTDSLVTELVSKIVKFHDWGTDIQSITHCFDLDFSKPTYDGEEGWQALTSTPESVDGFCSNFANARAARTWLNRYLDNFLLLEQNCKSVHWQESLIHQDLRSDNILFSNSRGPLFVDWPYLSVGPRIMDLAFLLPSIRGEGGPHPSSIIGIYENLSGVRFSSAEVQTAATLIAGFFADRAHQPPLAALPRVRWVQRLQMFPAINWMCEVLQIEPPPTPRAFE